MKIPSRIQEKNRPVLGVRTLCKTYRSRAGSVVGLENLDLSISSGEIFGLLGPNGAGKTTAVNMIMGFLHPDHGEISFRGKRLKTSEPRTGIGYLPERFRPNPQLTVGQYVSYQCQLAGMALQEIETEVRHLLGLVGMADVADRKISHLSKGMGQRVGLAQAFAASPALLVLDEPTSGLDPLGRREVIDLLFTLKEQGKTIFFCSHILAEVERVCDRIGILVDGKLRFIGSPEQFQDKWQVENLEEAFVQEASCVRS